MEQIPEIFSQLHMIHALVDRHSIPCTYALLPDKIWVTYNKSIQELKNLANCTPVTAMINFEKAMRNTLFGYFHKNYVKSYFFHLYQKIYRKMQEFGFQKHYQKILPFLSK